MDTRRDMALEKADNSKRATEEVIFCNLTKLGMWSPKAYSGFVFISHDKAMLLLFLANRASFLLEIIQSILQVVTVALWKYLC